jgi:hypothetical protein
MLDTWGLILRGSSQEKLAALILSQRLIRPLCTKAIVVAVVCHEVSLLRHLSYYLFHMLFVTLPLCWRAL